MKTKEIIISHMGIEEEEYNEIVFYFATAYLLDQGFNDTSISILQQSAYFWKWWQNQFDRRNHILIHELLLDVLTPDKEREKGVRIAFFNAHKPWTLNIEVNRVVLEASFDREVVQLIIKSIRHEKRKLATHVSA